MKKNILLTLAILTFTFVLPVAVAQNTVSGTIKDDVEGIPVPYAKITVAGISTIYSADEEGQFSISLPKDNHLLIIESMGYNSATKTLTFTSKKRHLVVEIKLVPSAQMLDVASIEFDKGSDEIDKVTNSLTIIQPKNAENRNITTVDALVNTVGGVAVVDNEPQIRGGSGFSSGMGSRVMILLDDMPLLRPDAGRPMWNFIPMEDVEQVNIVKGAASVVYGSSALTGAINVISAYPRLKPHTKVIVYGGIYSKPENKGETSWNHRNPVKYGASFMHSRIIKKNFDFVIGGEFFRDEGYIGPEETVLETRNTDGRQDGNVVENRGPFGDRGKYEMRGRINFSTRYRFEKVKGLFISLNGNFMYDQNAQSFFWNDGFDNKYRTYEGSLSYFKDFTFYVDPVVKYVSPSGNGEHSFRNRILYSDNAEMSGTQSARSMMVFDEYQYSKKFDTIGMHLIASVTNTYSTSYGAVFNGVKGSDTPVGISSDNLSIYAQLEQKFLNRKNLTVQLGARWEFYKMFGSLIQGEFQQKPIFRAGINYQIPSVKTSFRASFGQGVRFPSIGEKFIAISVGQYGFYPNPNLKSESSWNLEAGIMQPFVISNFRGMFDVAVYDQEYKNFIEFSMGQWGNTGGIMERMGFMYLNIGPARISGVDVSFMSEIKISKVVSCNVSLSYTYSKPVTKNRDYVYYTHENGKEFTFANSSSDTTRNILKYRIEHMAKADVEFVFAEKFVIGVSATYFSQMKNIDKFFFEYDGANEDNSEVRNQMLTKMGLPFYGYSLFYKNNSKGSVSLDARISYTFQKKATLSFVVKNVLNASYCIRPMYMEPLRTFNLQFVYDLK